MSSRVVHCEDALAWLEAAPVLEGCSLVTSLPDVSEFRLSLAEWKTWFTNTASLVLSRCSSDGVTVFFQSDITVDGAWVDKAYLVQKAAEARGHALLWHKIACRAPAGTLAAGRPAYSHVLCFAPTLRLRDPKDLRTDVLPSTGEKTWESGMGLDVCRMVARFVQTHTRSHTVVNPFCGEGAMLAAANAEGLSAIGIERSVKRCERARLQCVRADGQGWANL